MAKSSRSHRRLVVSSRLQQASQEMMNELEKTSEACEQESALMRALLAESKAVAKLMAEEDAEFDTCDERINAIPQGLQVKGAPLEEVNGFYERHTVDKRTPNNQFENSDYSDGDWIKKCAGKPVYLGENGYFIMGSSGGAWTLYEKIPSGEYPRYMFLTCDMTDEDKEQDYPPTANEWIKCAVPLGKNPKVPELVITLKE